MEPSAEPPAGRDAGRPPARLRVRLGLALAAPRRALAAADDPADPGRAGTDVVALLALLIVAVHTRDVVAAVWLGARIDLGLGARALADEIGRGITAPLAFVLIAAVVICAAAGRRRAPGRDFDLACVAVIPAIAVQVVATLVVRAAGVDVPAIALWVIAYGWSSAVVVLAIAQARARRPRGDAPAVAIPPAARRAGAWAGAALAAALAAVLAVNAEWVIRHLDVLRPMASGDRAPAFALPRIEAGGAPGAAVRSEELIGKVVVLDFWATWCGPCRDALPALSALAERRREDIVVLSITLDEPAAARALFDAEAYRTALVADAGGAAERFGVSSIPHLVVIDRDGVVRMVSRGEGNLRAVIGLAERLAAE